MSTERVRTQMVQMLLPWFDPAGELYYSPMTISEPGKVDRRKAFKYMRRWYKDQIGVKVDKMTLERVWKRRHVTWAVDEQDINDYINKLAMQTYEETKEESDSEVSSGASSEAGV